MYKNRGMSTETETSFTAGRTDLPFDPDAFRDKYREERDKRLRADANDQYIEITGVKDIRVVEKGGDFGGTW